MKTINWGTGMQDRAAAVVEECNLVAGEPEPAELIRVVAALVDELLIDWASSEVGTDGLARALDSAWVAFDRMFFEKIERILDEHVRTTAPDHYGEFVARHGLVVAFGRTTADWAAATLMLTGFTHGIAGLP